MDWSMDLSRWLAELKSLALTIAYLVASSPPLAIAVGCAVPIALFGFGCALRMRRAGRGARAEERYRKLMLEREVARRKRPVELSDHFND